MRVQVADAPLSVPTFEGAGGGHANRSGVHIHDPRTDHRDQPRKEVQAVRRYAVAARVGNQPRAQPSPIVVESGIAKYSNECVEQFLIGDSHLRGVWAGGQALAVRSELSP